MARQENPFFGKGELSWAELSAGNFTSPDKQAQARVSVPVWLQHSALGLTRMNPTSWFLISLALLWHHQPVASREMVENIRLATMTTAKELGERNLGGSGVSESWDC